MTRFCPACRKVLLAGALTVQIMNNDYHSSCLHCIKCGRNLFDKGFVKRTDGKLCCEEGACDQQGSSPTNNTQWLQYPTPTAAQSSPRPPVQVAPEDHGLKLRSHSIKNQQTYSINDQFVQQQPPIAVAPITVLPAMTHNNNNNYNNNNNANKMATNHAPYATLDDLNNNNNNKNTGKNSASSSGSESIRSGASSPVHGNNKYFVDSNETSPKLYANNGQTTQAVHSYNLGNFLKRSNKRNDSSHVIGSFLPTIMLLGFIIIYRL